MEAGQDGITCELASPLDIPRTGCAQGLSRVRLFATPWTVAHQAPPSMGFSRQEYWSGLPFPLLICNTNSIFPKIFFFCFQYRFE